MNEAYLNGTTNEVRMAFGNPVLPRVGAKSVCPTNKMPHTPSKESIRLVRAGKTKDLYVGTCKNCGQDTHHLLHKKPSEEEVMYDYELIIDAILDGDDAGRLVDEMTTAGSVGASAMPKPMGGSPSMRAPRPATTGKPSTSMRSSTTSARSVR